MPGKSTRQVQLVELRVVTPADTGAGAVESRWLSLLLEYSYAWLPDLSRLDWRYLALYALPIDGENIGLAILMALAYVVTLLAIAVLVFERRNFI